MPLGRWREIRVQAGDTDTVAVAVGVRAARNDKIAATTEAEIVSGDVAGTTTTTIEIGNIITTAVDTDLETAITAEDDPPHGLEAEITTGTAGRNAATRQLLADGIPSAAKIAMTTIVDVERRQIYLQPSSALERNIGCSENH